MKGNVAFSSATAGWSFTLQSFAQLYADVYGVTLDARELVRASETALVGSYTTQHLRRRLINMRPVLDRRCRAPISPNPDCECNCITVDSGSSHVLWLHRLQARRFWGDVHFHPDSRTFKKKAASPGQDRTFVSVGFLRPFV